MKLAAAQIKDAHNTALNMQEHLRMIDLAAQQKVDLIVFPELSLSGYVRESAGELAFSEKDARLKVFQDLADAHHMCIVIGAPLKLDGALHISSFIFQPGRSVSIYTKQYLHEGEELFYAPSAIHNPLLEIEGEKISIAICADINHVDHAAKARQRKSTLYLAGIFYTPNGIAEGHAKLAAYAKEYAMNILMANYVGSSYGMQAAGQSACWNPEGQLIKQLNATEENLLIVEI